MLFWFAGAAVVTAWVVLHDPAFDLRFLVAGALVADVVDGLTGGPAVLHSVAGCAVVLGGVMLATRGHRQARRGLLAGSFGLFLHLVFDGAWRDTQVFWWPAFGLDLGDGQLPSIARGWWNLPLELAGLAGLAWAWRRFGLRDPERRRRFLRTGHLGRDLAT